MRKIIYFVFLITLTGILRADQIASTMNGKKVILHDDKTWEYKKADTDSSINEPLTPSSNAIEEWKNLRVNQDSEEGKVVTWNVRIWNTSEEVELNGGPGAFVNVDYNFKVVLLGKGVSDFIVDDLAVVRAKFVGVNSEGEVVLKLLKYKKTGISN